MEHVSEVCVSHFFVNNIFEDNLNKTLNDVCDEVETNMLYKDVNKKELYKVAEKNQDYCVTVEDSDDENSSSKSRRILKRTIKIENCSPKKARFEEPSSSSAQSSNVGHDITNDQVLYSPDQAQCRLPSPVSLERSAQPSAMESNDSSEFVIPKLEAIENEQDCYRVARLHWTSENTSQLIETLERECQVLWNVKHPNYKDRIARQLKLEVLADMFETTPEEISRKIHNLRTQYNNELRKIKKKQETGETTGKSKWDYFDSLAFLKTHNFNDTSPDPLEIDAVNLELAQFQADEEETFGVAARSFSKRSSGTRSPVGGRRPVQRVTASTSSPALPPSMWPDLPAPKILPTKTDECQIFGDFVASELRSLRSDESRRFLKRLIQKSILQVSEAEEARNAHRNKNGDHAME